MLIGLDEPSVSIQGKTQKMKKKTQVKLKESCNHFLFACNTKKTKSSSCDWNFHDNTQWIKPDWSHTEHMEAETGENMTEAKCDGT